MKRAFVIILVLALCASALAACGENKAGTSESSAGPESSSAGESASSEAKTESSAAEAENRSGLEIMYCSFSEKPYFALVGKCAEGATVFGESEGYSFSSLSWHGWFSLRLKCEGRTVDVKLYQKVSGETVGEPYVYTAKPKTPGSDMWPIVTGGDFQFFFQKMLPDYQKTNIPAANRLSSLTARVKTRLESLRANDPEAEIIYLLVPSEMSVYPELVPEQYSSPEGESRLDLINAALREGGATVIDLKSVFAEHKNDEMPLYYHLDSHWSDYGAFVAYTALLEHIAERFPAAAPRRADEFNWNADFYDSGDMTYYLAMSQTDVKEYAYYRTPSFDMPTAISAVPRYRRASSLTYSDDVTYERNFNTDRPELPDAVVIRDSYSTQMFDVLAERFDRSHYFGMWDYGWRANVISDEKPNYVIYIIAEWNIDSVLNG